MNGICYIGAVDVAESFDCPFLGEGGVALVVVDGIVDVYLQVIFHFGQADHMGCQVGIFPQLLNSLVVFLYLVLPVGIHGFQVLVEELKECVGESSTQGYNICKIPIFVAIDPVLMVSVPPSLQQQISDGKVVIGLSESLVYLVELLFRANDYVADVPGCCCSFGSLGIFVHDIVKNNLFLCLAERGIANAEYFLDDFPRKVFVKDLPGSQSGVIAHNPILQFENLLIALCVFDKHFVKNFQPIFISDGDILKFFVDCVEDDSNLIVEVVPLEVVVDVA